MRSDLICCYYILEKRGKLHRYIKLKTTSQRETSGSPVPLPPNGAAATTKSLLRIRNRAIHSPLPTLSHWAPPSASSLRGTPWSRPTLCSTPHPPPICWFTGLYTLTEPAWSLILSLMQYYNYNHKSISLITLFLENVSRWWVTCFPGRLLRQRRITSALHNTKCTSLCPSPTPPHPSPPLITYNSFPLIVVMSPSFWVPCALSYTLTCWKAMANPYTTFPACQ